MTHSEWISSTCLQTTKIAFIIDIIIIKSCVHLLLRQSQTQRFERFREHCRKCQHRPGDHCIAALILSNLETSVSARCSSWHGPSRRTSHICIIRVPAQQGRARRGGAGRCLISRLPGRPLNNCARHEARYCILPSCAHHSCSAVYPPGYW